VNATRLPLAARHASALLACAGLLGCVQATRAVPATAVSGEAMDDDAAQDLYDQHRHHHQGGVTMFIALSLDTLGLPPERKSAVAKIQSELFAKMEPARVDEQEVLTALAEGIAAGAIDKAKVDAAIARVESASALTHDATAAALNELHGVLTPAERRALVDKVRAHWAVFDATATGRPSNRIDALAQDLGLSPAQVARIGASYEAMMSAAVPAVGPAQVEAHLERLSAFREDAFDATKLVGGAAANAHVAQRGAKHMAYFYEAVDPQLTPEQRAKLVVILREHAGHGPNSFAAGH
jgi:Spy/CpxP family protein refolding chaperone